MTNVGRFQAIMCKLVHFFLFYPDWCKCSHYLTDKGLEFNNLRNRELIKLASRVLLNQLFRGISH